MWASTRTPSIREAITLVRDNCRWEHAGQPFFDGEVEPCINGRTVAIGAYFGVDVDGIVTRLLGEQLPDSGWNREAENLCDRGTARAPAGNRRFSGVRPGAPARGRAGARLLQRRLFRRLSTGEIIEPTWLRFSFPTWWHYDPLRALDYFRAAGDTHDPRLAEAIGVVRSAQRLDGTWQLDNTHRGAVYFAMEDGDGEPSRWNTLRALRLLNWYDRPVASTSRS